MDALDVPSNGCQCVGCGRDDGIVPLVALRFDGQAAWICPQCLPTLIHHPERLTGKLGGVEALDPVRGHD